MAGRKKKYATPAERQKAYRQRKYLAGEGETFEGVLRYFQDKQEELCRKKNYKILERADHKRRLGYFYLVEDDEGKLFIAERYFHEKSKKKKFVDHKDYIDNDSAQEEFDYLKEGKITGWGDLDDYFEQAKSFISAKERGEDVVLNELPLGLLMAIVELLEVGTDEHLGSMRNRSESRKYGKRSMRTVSFYIVRDINLFSLDIDQQRRFVYRSFQKLALVSEKSSIAEGTYFKRCEALIDAFKLALDYPKEFSHIMGLSEIALRLRDKVYEESKTVDTEVKGIRAKKNHPFQQLNQVKAILDIAWLMNRELYHYCLLSLTIGLRPDEVKKLVNNPERYVLPDNSLNFKGIGISNRNDYLLTKTIKKVNPETLENPDLSIVARLILKKHKPELCPSDFFEKTHNSNFRVQYENLEPFHERTYRPTMGHMLAYCDRASDPSYRCDKSKVQERMGHSNDRQVRGTYAKVPPDKRPPEIYFNFPGDIYFRESDLNLTKGTPLWDGWLLKDYIERHLACLDDQAGLEFKMEVLEFAKEYQQDVGIIRKEQKKVVF